MGFSFIPSPYSYGVPPCTLFTAYASRTHVKAPQTDFHVKHDNSSGSTNNSPSETPLRTKATFQHKTAPKKHREHETVRGAPKPNPDQLSSTPYPGRESGPRPEGRHRDQDGSLFDARSHGRSIGSIRSDSMAPCHDPRSIQCLDWKTGFGFSLFGKKDFIFLSLFIFYLDYPLSYRDLYYRAADFAA